VPKDAPAIYNTITPRPNTDGRDHNTKGVTT
jgi:hypothetical protein